MQGDARVVSGVPDCRRDVERRLIGGVASSAQQRSLPPGCMASDCSSNDSGKYQQRHRPSTHQ
jgi:hypothetical protein